MSTPIESSQSQTLSLEEKRQVIYASLLRFKPEAMELRQRALERVVLSALLGSNESDTYKLDKIQRNLKKSAKAPEIREEMIREALYQLVRDGMVKRLEQKSWKSYCLTQKGQGEMTQALNQAVDVFQPVLKKMLQDIDHLISRELGEQLCRSFIMECFARLGRQIAHSIVGRLDKEDLASSSEVQAAFAAAVSGRNLPVETRESLYNRCVKFLRSSETEDEQLKLRLTQGFFLAELLCIHGAPFDPLSSQAFNGAVLYLDTNIVLLGLVSAVRRQQLFNEMVRLAAKLGIQLRITRATIDETRSVLAKKREDLEKYIEKVPEALTELTHDEFLTAYLEAREKEPSLNPKEFLSPFDRLTEIIEQEWKLKIDDRKEDEILRGRKFEKESVIIQEEAIAIASRHGHPKSERVLLHDVAHFAVIVDGRSSNSKLWFLTADRSLVRAASRLVGQGAAAGATATGPISNTDQQSSLPFCFISGILTKHFSLYVFIQRRGFAGRYVFCTNVRISFTIR
jgi:DNA-binding HxlR family transcriptional regulator